MWFEDLTPYRYGTTSRSGGTLWRVRATAKRVLNIGWLDAEHAFDAGPTPEIFRRILKILSEHPVDLMRGEQTCALCGDATGKGEVRVSDGDTTYAAPQLVYHYVMEHDYRPPEIFIKIVSGAGRG